MDWKPFSTVAVADEEVLLSDGFDGKEGLRGLHQWFDPQEQIAPGAGLCLEMGWPENTNL